MMNRPRSHELSRRELEVLKHIRQGLTNRQIAQLLYVSPNTINKHVRQVLRKLSVRNRVQAAIFDQGGPQTREPARRLHGLETDQLALVGTAARGRAE